MIFLISFVFVGLKDTVGNGLLKALYKYSRDYELLIVLLFEELSASIAFAMLA
jgi:hypothetical protein